MSRARSARGVRCLTETDKQPLKAKHMSINSFRQRVGSWLAIALLLCAGLAMAQSGPTMNQVYEAAKAGKYEQAETMMQQVLVAYPNSAKAHFVLAELLARQGKVGPARQALGTAENLAPGLPFAKTEAVQTLRTQLAGKNTPPATDSTTKIAPRAGSMPAKEPSGFPWTLALVLGAGLIALGIFALRRKPRSAFAPQPSYANQEPVNNGLNGPQNFGMGGAGGGAMAPGNIPQAGSGLGGRVMGGLATGLAVGAGVMAAQAIGKSLMGNEAKPEGQAANPANNGYEPIAGNNEMGGQNFGINDGGSWDDGSAVANSGDGGDWES